MRPAAGTPRSPPRPRPTAPPGSPALSWPRSVTPHAGWRDRPASAHQSSTPRTHARPPSAPLLGCCDHQEWTDWCLHNRVTRLRSLNSKACRVGSPAKHLAESRQGEVALLLVSLAESTSKAARTGSRQDGQHAAGAVLCAAAGRGRSGAAAQRGARGGAARRAAGRARRAPPAGRGHLGVGAARGGAQLCDQPAAAGPVAAAAAHAADQLRHPHRAGEDRLCGARARPASGAAAVLSGVPPPRPRCCRPATVLRCGGQVERFGRYLKTLTPGLHFLIPLVRCTRPCVLAGAGLHQRHKPTQTGGARGADRPDSLRAHAQGAGDTGRQPGCALRTIARRGRSRAGGWPRGRP